MSPEQALRAFCAALVARDPEALAAPFGPNGLLEFPFLKPRLVGAAEVREGFRRAFEVASDSEIELIALKKSERVAIAEGTLRARIERDGLDLELPCALVVVVVIDDALSRLSVHADARPYRLWTDGPVLARAIS